MGGILRQCEFESPQSAIRIHVQFAFANVLRTFSSDWHDPALPYSFTYPVATTAVFNNSAIHGQNVYGSLDGGAHLSNYLFSPYQVLKSLDCTDHLGDGKFSPDDDDVGHIVQMAATSVLGADAVIQTQWTNPNRTIPVEEAIGMNPRYEEIYVIPEYLLANEERYPSWFGRQDPRAILGKLDTA